jgi:ABC-type multidrug transport system fused ATPase/permease subunit
LSLKNLVTFFLLIFFFRCLISIIISFYRGQLVKNVNDDLSQRIYSNYLNQDYIFFLKNNSSSLISNVIHQIDNFSYRVIDNFILLFTELVVVISIITYLLFIYFKGSLILIFTILFFFIFLFTKFKSEFKKLGSKKIIYDSYKINDLQKSFHIIQNIKLDNLENFFIKKFEKNTQLSSKSYFFLQVLTEIPRPLIELIFLTMIFLIMYIFYHYLSLSKAEILSMMALFGVSIFRLLPSCNKIMNCSNVVKYYSSTVDVIFNEINNLKNRNISNNNCTFNDIITLDNVTFCYPETNKIIFNNVNLTIKKNEIVGIQGDSGSGKSTLLNVISYLLKPDSGKIYIDKILIENVFTAYQKKIGYVSQKTYLTEESLLENIALGVEKTDIDYNLFEEVIKKSNLDKFIRELSLGKNTLLGEKGSWLSGGQQQRIGIARALYKKPEILILDEATNALDEKSELEIFNTIQKLKNTMTVIIVSHKKILFDFCDKVFELKNGLLSKIK